MAAMHNPAQPDPVLREALSEASRNFSGHSVRLSEAFGQNQPDLWLRMQSAYDLWQASQIKRKRIKPLTCYEAAS